jgi:transcriptional regulator with XRE-family HTH domain
MQEAPKGPRNSSSNFRASQMKRVIGTRIRMIRERQDITQKDLAVTLGVRPNCLRAAEQGMSLSLELFADAADALDVTLDALLPVDWEKL